MIAGPQGIETRLAQVMEALFEHSSKTKQKFDLSVVALKPEEKRSFGAVDVTPFSVVHGESGGPFLAYRVEAEGRVIAYSADTEWTETLIPLGRDADLFIAEAYYYDRIVKNHLSLKTLEAHLPEIKPKRLVLTHMSDDMLGRLDTLEYTAASDGMVVEFDRRPSFVIARSSCDEAIHLSNAIPLLDGLLRCARNDVDGPSDVLNRPVLRRDRRRIGADDFRQRVAPRAQQRRGEVGLDVSTRPRPL